LLLLFFCVVVSCNRNGDPSSNDAKGKTSGAEPEEWVPVKVSNPHREDISLSLRTTTSIEADEEADVYSKSIGLCRAIYAEEGDNVRQGDLLAKLDDKEIMLTLEQVRARLDKVTKDHERSETLFNEGLLSKQRYQDVTLQLELAKADYELAEKRLKDTSILATLSGVITKRNCKVGDLVTTTQPLFKIENLDRLVARVHIPEQDYQKVHKGQEAVLTLDAFAGKRFAGTVERVNPVIDSQSGTAEVTVAIENPEGFLRPGMFARVGIITALHRDALVIPKEAILIEGEKKVVYVVREGMAREVFVRTGFQDTDRVEVLEGLAQNDRVVVMGQLGLQGDTKVRIIEESNG